MVNGSTTMDNRVSPIQMRNHQCWPVRIPGTLRATTNVVFQNRGYVMAMTTAWTTVMKSIIAQVGIDSSFILLPISLAAINLNR